MNWREMMLRFLSKLLSRWFSPGSTQTSSNKEDTDLKQFFTDSEEACNAFEELISTVPFSKRLLVIHGIGSVGKSTLLMMYHLTCLQQHIAIALVRGEEAKSSLDVLGTWASELTTNNIILPTLQKTLAYYRALESKVEISVQEMPRTAKMSKDALGSIVRATTSLIPIPIINSLAGDLGAASVEAIAKRLQSSLSKPDLEFYLDPTARVTNDFLHDVSQAASRHRIVLVIDTFEQMTTLDDWVRNLAKRLPESLLLVIAGRDVPQWDRAWPEWIGKAKIVELKEMTPDDIRKLVHRYYTYIHGEGEPDPNQVEAIVQFARGLPMVATTAVRLWVKEGVEDFQAVRSQVVLDLADRLLEGVPQEMRPVFELAAILRYFNTEILQALLGSSDIDDLYAKLRRWPFIHSRSEGLAVHDTMRELLNKALRLNKPERFHALHQQTMLFYEAKLQNARGEERERYTLERIYHRILADEKSGIQLFQETAEAFVLYRFIVRLRSLLKDMETYKRELDEENILLWLKYYSAQLTYLEGKWEEAERIYQEIEEKKTEPKLRAYVLCDHGRILSQLEWKRKEGSSQNAVEFIQRAFSLFPLDRKLVVGHKSLSAVYEFQGDMEQAEHHLQQMLQFYKEQGDAVGVANVSFDLRWHYMLRGNWKKMLEAHETGVESIAPFLDISPAWKEEALRVNWGHIWMGRYREYGDNHRKIVEDVLPQMIDPYVKSECLYRVGFGEGMQGKFHEAHRHFNESFAIQQALGLDRRKDFQGVFRGLWGAVYTKQGEFEEAEHYLGEALAIKQEAQDTLGIPEVLLWLGELSELRHMWDRAENCYRQCLEEYKLGRPYFDGCALTGMMRVRYSQQQYDLIPSLFDQAEPLAQQNEYYDNLASLHLTKGHLVWDGHIPEWDSGFDAAFRCYQVALICALRYNRFLLDEVLTGRPHGTTLQPIIPHCLKRGKEGQQMLLKLRNWWQSGSNDIGTPRPDSISQILEGVSLLEGERLARLKELGDGTPQQTVLEQLDNTY